jgi:hypothetical protein
MKPYFRWSLLIGMIALLAPPASAFLVSNALVVPMIVSAMIACTWLAFLVWGLRQDGVRGLLLLLPSLFMVLAWPSFFTALFLYK